LGRRSKFSPEFKHDAVELVRASSESMRKVAADLGLHQETLRGWVNQDRVDRGEGKPGELTTAEKQELVRLRRENVQLRMEREILKKAAAFFAKETTR
jgi:transposase